MKARFTIREWLIIALILFPVAMYLMAKDYWRAVKNAEVKE